MATATSVKVTYGKALKVLTGLGCTLGGDYYDGDVLGPDGSRIASGATYAAVETAYQDVVNASATLRPALSEKQYAKGGGSACPMCLGDNISADEVEVEAGSAYQRVTCETCGWVWQDAYELKGYLEANG